MTYTSRERVLRAMHFEKPDRVPFNFHLHPRTMMEWEKRFGPDFQVRHYGVDVVESFLSIPYPRGEVEQCGGWPWVRSAAFENWEDAADIPLPDPSSPAIYEKLDAALQRYPDRAILAQISGVLGVAGNMRPAEYLYAEILQHEEAVQHFFHRLSDIMTAVADRVCRKDITALYVMDDIGFKDGLLMSPDQFRRLILPHWKKPIAAAKALGKPVFFHTDGKVDALWDIFADELEIRMLHAAEPQLMSMEDFKKRYHGRMGIYGGLDAARIPAMSPKEIREHVFELFESAGAGGGLVMSAPEMESAVSEETILTLTNAIKACVYG